MTIKLGTSGPEVESWQRTLAAFGYRVVPDGKFGPATEKLTIQFQHDRGLVADGIVGPSTLAEVGRPVVRSVSPDMFDQGLRYIPAKYFTKPSKPRVVTTIVQHVMQNRQSSSTAEAVGAWFSGPDSRKASSHAGCDQDSVVQYVLPSNIAWGAQGANWCGYHVENAGWVSRTAEDWAKPENESMLILNAKHVSLACAHFGIPKARLSVDDVAVLARDALIRQGKRKGDLSGHPGGICGHYDVTRCWQDWAHYGLPNPKNEGWWPDHVDPGAGYPWGHYLEILQAIS